MMRLIAGLVILILGTPVLLAQAQPNGGVPPPSSDWSRVAHLAPGAPLTVFIADLPALHRVMVWADGTELVVLNSATVHDRGARSDLLDLAIHHPEDLISPRVNIIAGRIHLAPDGAFVNGQRIGDVSETVERISRHRVFEVSANVTHAGAAAGAAVGDTFGGLFLGAILGAALEPACHCDDPGVTGAVFGAPVGALLGGIAAARLVTPTQEVIFRQAPPPTEEGRR